VEIPESMRRQFLSIPIWPEGVNGTVTIGLLVAFWLGVFVHWIRDGVRGNGRR
jgi:hypothetical protein